MINPVRFSLTCLAFAFPIVAHSQARPLTCLLTHNQTTLARSGVGTGVGGGNVELWRCFKQARWSGEKAPHFFFRSDRGENFRDQDKFGHLLGGYQLTRVGYEALRASCVSEKRALIAGVAYAAPFQLQIEVFDGMYNTYGFSYADVHALLPTKMQSYWPSLLRASIGHSITEYIDPVTGASNRARRKLLFSVDIDPEKLCGQLTPTFQALDWYR